MTKWKYKFPIRHTRGNSFKNVWLKGVKINRVFFFKLKYKTWFFHWWQKALTFLFFFTQKPFDLDDLLPKIGQFGRYQKLLLFLIVLPACIPCGFCAFNQLFMTETPSDYWCAVPDLNNITSSVQERKFLAIPSEVYYHAPIL